MDRVKTLEGLEEIAAVINLFFFTEEEWARLSGGFLAPFPGTFGD